MNTHAITKDAIETAIKNSGEPNQAVVAVYELATADRARWGRWPQVHPDTYNHISGLFMQRWQLGGILTWMNYGFTVVEDLPAWTVRVLDPKPQPQMQAA